MKITNNRGDIIEFGHHFKLLDGFNLSGLSANVNILTSNADGAHYQNTKLNSRDFDVRFFIDVSNKEKFWIEERRKELFTILNPKHNPMRIDFTTKACNSYYLYAQITSVPFLADGFENSNSKWQKGLLQFISADPYVYNADANRVDIALWVPNFEFALELTSDGIEMGYRSPSLIVNVNNSGQEVTGMNIQFKALNDVVNPKLLNVNTYDELKLNVSMIPGDAIDISTYRGKRSIILTRNNVQTNIFNTLDLSSAFLQLEVGDNLFRYDATSGLEHLEVSMTYTTKMVGV